MWRYKFGGTPQQLLAMKAGCYRSLNRNIAGTDWRRMTGHWEIARTFAAVLLLSALLTLLLAVAAVAVAMSHYCRSRYDLVAILKTLGAGRAQLRKLIIGQWLMVLGLSAVTGGAIGLLFENILLVLLKPVLPADLPPASLWPRCGRWAR